MNPKYLFALLCFYSLTAAMEVPVVSITENLSGTELHARSDLCPTTSESRYCILHDQVSQQVAVFRNDTTTDMVTDYCMSAVVQRTLGNSLPRKTTEERIYDHLVPGVIDGIIRKCTIWRPTPVQRYLVLPLIFPAAVLIALALAWVFDERRFAEGTVEERLSGWKDLPETSKKEE